MGWTKDFIKENINSFTVYMHTNKRNNKKYIGITGQKPKYRWRGGNGYYRNPHFYNAIKKYGWDNFEHEILYENLTKEEAIKKEKYLIEKYNTTNRDKGYNIGFGGEGVESLSLEAREKIRQANLGRKFSEETKRKISESRTGEKNWNYGKKLPEWHIEILRNANLGRKLTEEQKMNIVEKEGYVTLQYDMDGNFINYFISTTMAAKALNMHSSGIKACCEKRIISNHNYIFRYQKDGYNINENLSEEEIKKIKISKRHILQCDLDGNIIQEWNNCKEASKALHIDRHDISDCIKGTKEKTGIYTWKKVS